MKRYMVKSLHGYLGWLQPGAVWVDDQRRALRVRGRRAAAGMVAATLASIRATGGWNAAELRALRVRAVALRWTP